MKIRNKVLVVGLFLAMFSVVLGAFTAHVLKSKVTTDVLEVFQTELNIKFIMLFI